MAKTLKTNFAMDSNLPMDKIWVCDHCRMTYAGGIAVSLYNLDAKQKELWCQTCRAKETALRMEKILPRRRDLV